MIDFFTFLKKKNNHKRNQSTTNHSISNFASKINWRQQMHIIICKNWTQPKRILGVGLLNMVISQWNSTKRVTSWPSIILPIAQFQYDTLTETFTHPWNIFHEVSFWQAHITIIHYRYPLRNSTATAGRYSILESDLYSFISTAISILFSWSKY